MYQEFQIQLTDLTVDNLLEQFTLAKHTGLEKPGKTLVTLTLDQGNIENIRYGSIEHKWIHQHLFDPTKFVFPKIAIA